MSVLKHILIDHRKISRVRLIHPRNKHLGMSFSAFLHLFESTKWVKNVSNGQYNNKMAVTASTTRITSQRDTQRA